MTIILSCWQSRKQLEEIQNCSSWLESVALLRCCCKKVKIYNKLQEEYLNSYQPSESPAVESMMAECFALIFLEDEHRAEALLERIESLINFKYELVGIRAENRLMLAVQIKKLKNFVISEKDIVELDELSCQVLLARAFLLHYFNPKNDSDRERIQAYLHQILQVDAEKMSLETKTAARYLRVKTMSPKMFEEKGMKELQEIHQIFSSGGLRPELNILLPTLREVEMELAEQYCRLGSLSAALELFEGLEMFDEQLACLIRLGDSAEAERLLRNQIDKNGESAQRFQYLCTLGSLIKDETLIALAWKESKEKYFPAARLLGQCYFSRSAWQEAIEWIEKALAGFPSDPSTWFLLGCSYLHVKEWDKATRALVRTVNLDAEHVAAWNNLAAAYSQRAGMGSEALEALKKASSLDYENIRIWQNVLQIASEVNDAATINHATKRINELKKH